MSWLGYFVKKALLMFHSSKLSAYQHWQCSLLLCLFMWDLQKSLATEISASGFSPYYFLSTLMWVGSLCTGNSMAFIFISKIWGSRKQTSFQVFLIPWVSEKGEGSSPPSLGVFSTHPSPTFSASIQDCRISTRKPKWSNPMILYSNLTHFNYTCRKLFTSEAQYGLQLYSDRKHYRINSFTVILLHEIWGSLNRFGFKHEFLIFSATTPLTFD